ELPREAVRGRREVEAPDLLQDEGALQHPPRAADEQLEQGELGPGQGHRATAALDLARSQVHRQVRELEQLVAVLLGPWSDPAQQCAEPREQLVQCERL